MDPDDEVYVPLYALNAYLYCPHRAYREYVLCEWADNVHTVDAQIRHRRVHQGTPRRTAVAPDRAQTRRVAVRSDRYRIAGVVDVVEDVGGTVAPVEYKRGRGGPWPNDEAQLCAQALCLEEQTGQPVERGYLWYMQSRRRFPVEMSPELRARTERVIEEVRAVMEGREVPRARWEPARCLPCSHHPVCLPRAVDALTTIDIGSWRRSLVETDLAEVERDANAVHHGQ